MNAEVTPQTIPPPYTVHGKLNIMGKKKPQKIKQQKQTNKPLNKTITKQNKTPQKQQPKKPHKEAFLEEAPCLPNRSQYIKLSSTTKETANPTEFLCSWL